MLLIQCWQTQIQQLIIVGLLKTEQDLPRRTATIKQCSVRASAWEHGVQVSVIFWLFLSVTFGTWLETCSACVSTFYVVSGTLHAVLLSLVLDVDEVWYYRSTSRTVGRRHPCYQWSSAYRRLVQKARKKFHSTPVQKASMQLRHSTKRVSWSRVPVCQHRSIFVFAVISGPRWRTWNSLLPNCA